LLTVRCFSNIHRLTSALGFSFSATAALAYAMIAAAVMLVVMTAGFGSAHVALIAVCLHAAFFAFTGFHSFLKVRGICDLSIIITK